MSIKYNTLTPEDIIRLFDKNDKFMFKNFGPIDIRSSPTTLLPYYLGHEPSSNKNHLNDIILLLITVST
ncbi:MAG: hypothetical protein ACXAD7_08020 [Candidatus Kariarchaeaceae archaeon]